MNKRTKAMLLIGPVLSSFMFALTSPTIHIYFISQIGPSVLAVTNIVTVGLGAIVNSTIPNDRLKEMYRRNFTNIVIVDVICFVIISMLGIEYAVVRFIGLAVLNAVSATLWTIIMRNAVNRKINGDELTNWESFSDSIVLYGSLIGGLIAFLFSDEMNVEMCVLGQCLANLIFGIADIKAFKRLECK